MYQPMTSFLFQLMKAVSQMCKLKATSYKFFEHFAFNKLDLQRIPGKTPTRSSKLGKGVVDRLVADNVTFAKIEAEVVGTL